MNLTPNDGAWKQWGEATCPHCTRPFSKVARNQLICGVKKCKAKQNALAYKKRHRLAVRRTKENRA